MNLVALYRKMLDLCLVERWLVRAFIARQLRGRDRMAEVCLDIGAGTAPFAPAIRRALPRATIIRLDLSARDGTDIVADGHRLPFRISSLDLVVSFQTLYAVEAPLDLLHEARRALREGGLVLITYPFMTGETGTRDLWRFTQSAMDRLLGNAGFETIAHERQGGLLFVLSETLAWLPARLLVRHARPWQSGRRPSDAARLALAFLLGLPFHLLGFAAVALDRMLGAQPWYIGGMVLARKRSGA